VRAPKRAGAALSHGDCAIEIHQVSDSGAHLLGSTDQRRSNVRFSESLIGCLSAQSEQDRQDVIDIGVENNELLFAVKERVPFKLKKQICNIEPVPI
jgi:hypothetical protein